MFIRAVDEGLEQLVRERLPFPADVGDVSFDPPTKDWAAQLSRLTVNLFLFHIDRSGQPSRSPQTRVAEDGRPERRAPQPMFELAYLVSVWAGSPRDEHQLLGDLVSMLAGVAVLPAELVPAASSSVVLTVGGDLSVTRETWQAVGGQIRASVILAATVATDTAPWVGRPPAVERISVLTAPRRPPTG